MSRYVFLNPEGKYNYNYLLIVQSRRLQCLLFLFLFLFLFLLHFTVQAMKQVLRSRIQSIFITAFLRLRNVLVCTPVSGIPTLL
jgi:hypothetical protein